MYQNYRNQLEQQNKTDKMADKKDLNNAWRFEPPSKMFEELSLKESKSLLKKHLTKELYEKLKDTKTKLGGTLADCINSGVKNPQSGVGIYACDPDAYTAFAVLFDAIIKDYHKTDALNHPTPTFGKEEDIKNDKIIGDLDKEGGDMIVSTRVRVGRSHDGFSFPPCLTAEKQLEMEKNTKAAFEKLPEGLKGTYYPLTGMKEDVRKQLVEDHFLFKDDDSCLRDAGGYQNWPTGRGIFHTPDKKFLVWLNEEDHLRFISMQQGGNLGEVYLRLVKAINSLESSLKFAKRDGLGYLTFCPTNLGTTLRASVHIKIPLLSTKDGGKALTEFCAKHNLQPRGIHGEHTESVGGVYDISNKRRLGLTEFQALKEMADGVREIIKEEKRLAAETQQKK